MNKPYVNLYKASWDNLMIILSKGYDLGCWLAPIPEEDRKKMLERGLRYYKSKKALKNSEPFLLGEVDEEGFCTKDL